MCGHCICGRHFFVFCLVVVVCEFLGGSLRERLYLRIDACVCVKRGTLFLCEILSYVWCVRLLFVVFFVVYL